MESLGSYLFNIQVVSLYESDSLEDIFGRVPPSQLYPCRGAAPNIATDCVSSNQAIRGGIGGVFI